MKKLIHIHSDHKFIYESYFFNFLGYENLIIYIDNNDFKYKLNDFKIFVFKHNYRFKENLNKLIQPDDIVVFYDLTVLNIAIINFIPNKRIYWRFFGHEIYDLNKAFYLSEESKIYSESNIKININVVKNFFSYRVRLFYFKFILNYNLNMYDAISKVSKVLMLYKEEYNFIKSQNIKLPKLKTLPFFNTQLSIPKFNPDRNRIILGNSRNDYNNHLDILNKIHTNVFYDVVIPFNYGFMSNYSRRVEDLAKEKNINLIYDVMDFHSYERFVKSSCALIINSYRQMGMGNILLAIKYGLKIYMNKRNTAFDFLRQENFLVFEATDFENDFKNNKCSLSLNQIKHNIEANNSFILKNNWDIFNKTILND